MSNLLLFTAMDGILIGIVVLMLVFMFWQGGRQRKMQSDYMAMLDTLRAGVRVKMASGVIGRIKEIREEAPGFKIVLIETGDVKNASYLTYTLDAVQGIVNEDVIMQLNAAAAANNIDDENIEKIGQKRKSPDDKDADFNAEKYVEKRNAATKKKAKTGK